MTWFRLLAFSLIVISICTIVTKLDVRVSNLEEVMHGR